MPSKGKECLPVYIHILRIQVKFEVKNGATDEQQNKSEHYTNTIKLYTDLLLHFLYYSLLLLGYIVHYRIIYCFDLLLLILFLLR